ncbi:hypothetical protein [Chelatococcus asaccharovorans]|nr:hypothetical protein [Chelatococcus asaccharovorans]MBS7703268.1 hypothetical protein [Chelatococcus asaccharovorans]
MDWQTDIQGIDDAARLFANRAPKSLERSVQSYREKRLPSVAIGMEVELRLSGIDPRIYGIYALRTVSRADAMRLDQIEFVLTVLIEAGLPRDNAFLARALALSDGISPDPSNVMPLIARIREAHAEVPA